MNGSYLIYGRTAETRLAKLEEIIKEATGRAVSHADFGKHPDIMVIDIPEDKKSIGIAETRLGIRFFDEKPYLWKQKILIVYSAHTLTREAQSALLKILEEPPSFGLIFLLCKTQKDLLETVVSRCRKVPVKEDTIIDRAKQTGKAQSSSKNSLNQVLPMKLGQRLDWASETAKLEREELIELLENWVEQGRGVLLKQPCLKTVKNIQSIQETKNNLENTNAIARLALEALVLNLK